MDVDEPDALQRPHLRRVRERKYYVVVVVAMAGQKPVGLMKPILEVVL